MEEENKRKLIEKIIKEQDLVSLYAFNHHNKSLGLLQGYGNGIYYSGLYRFILENPEIMDNFSIKNLYTLLAKSSKDEDKKIINEKIAEKNKSEEFFLEPLDTEGWGMSIVYSNIAYGKIDENTRKQFEPKVLEELKTLKGTEYEKIARNIKTYPDLINFLKYYKDGIFTPEKIETINKMIDKNPDALRYVNFGLFQDEIFELGSDFCEYISKFPTMSYQLLLIKEKNSQMFSVIADRLKNYDNIKDNLSELETLITYGARNVFELQSEKIEIDDFLECANRNSKDFGLINVSYGNQYQKRLEEKLKTEYDKTETIEDKLNVYMNKVYSISLNGARGLLKDFGEDLENLENLSDDTKHFFYELSNSVELDDETQINELFNSSTKRYSTVQIEKMKSEIKKECAREFSEEFRNTDKKIQQKLQKNIDVTEIEYNNKKIKQIKLNGNFNLLFHSTDAEFINAKNVPENFKEEWKVGKNKNNHIISTTCANQDFLGMAPVEKNGVRYVFSKVKRDNIRLMGISDINTLSNNFAYDSHTRKYMSTKALSYNSRRVYSEFGIERDGVIPDYVAICDDDLPEVIENSYKAAAQFDIPILYIDKSEIEKAQIEKLENLLEEFNDTKDTNILQKLLNTYETNVAGWLLNRSEDLDKDDSHTAKINNSRFKEDFEKIQVKIENTVKEFLEEKGKKIQSEKEIMEVMTILLREIELYDGCEEITPISKTKISYNAKGLLQEANKSLHKIGKDELKVNLDEHPSSKKYELKIQQLVKNALSGKDALTIEDIYKAKKMQEKAKEEILSENRRGGDEK